VFSKFHGPLPLENRESSSGELLSCKLDRRKAGN
jgi:hypothetical protein